MMKGMNDFILVRDGILSGLLVSLIAGLVLPVPIMACVLIGVSSGLIAGISYTFLWETFIGPIA